jgi:glycerol-3-phosphate acyltransferase PlsY
MNLWLITLPLAYLLGSIPFGYLLVRFFRKEDIRALGSGNIGATNVARSGARGLGILTLFLDALKGYLAVVIAMHLAPSTTHGPSSLAVAAAVVAVLGHVFPVWLGFKGGKGIATALGVFIALVPPVALASFFVFLLVVLITPCSRSSSCRSTPAICSPASASSRSPASSSTTPTSPASSKARSPASARRNPHPNPKRR